ncbi:MAG TPA: type II secretion system protein G [Candidatus Wallbacteria bacterium]|nr:type II secretion system protein G [Candidatus Wallbacteria bacterium]
MNIEKSRSARGFTLIEAVMVVIFLSILSSAAVQGYSSSVMRNRENNLKLELLEMRSAIDRFYLDRLREDPSKPHFDRFPKSLEQLVELKYIRKVPVDPVTDRATWEVILVSEGSRRVFDVRSTSRGISSEKNFYNEW